MLHGLLRKAYRRCGARYPAIALVVGFSLVHPVVFGGVALLTLYQSMSAEQFRDVVLISQLAILLDNAWSVLTARRLLRPAQPWLRGDHTPSAALRAWQALVGLPLRFVSERGALPFFVTAVPTCLYIVWRLHLPWYLVLAVLAGAAVVLMYAAALRFFAMELGLRPVLVRVSDDLPEHVDFGSESVPLGWRLLVVLPLINVITGVVVSALSTDGTARLSDLGVDVLIALGVAFTLSLELTLLLSRSVLKPIRELRAATQRVMDGDLSVRVPVLSADETGQLAQSFNQMVAGLAERERLHHALESYVAPDVADRVLSQGAVIEGDEREVSVLFLDIRDFTAFAERSTAREVLALLNEFWEVVVPLLTKHGGHANKFVGDGLLGVFGAPDRLSDHADRAVAAALEIAAAVRDHYDGRVRIGIGVNSGDVLAGTTGGGGKLDFTVIGDVVNTASRVESATRATGDTILITEATRRLLRESHGGFLWRTTAQLQGKRSPVALFAPCGAAPIGAPIHEPVVRRAAIVSDARLADGEPAVSRQEPEPA